MQKNLSCPIFSAIITPAAAICRAENRKNHTPYHTATLFHTSPPNPCGEVEGDYLAFWAKSSHLAISWAMSAGISLLKSICWWVTGCTKPSVLA